MEGLFCEYFKPTYAGGYAVTAAYTRDDAYHDVFVSAYHNNRYVTFWTDGENPESTYRYPIYDYYEKPDFCD